VRRVQLPGHAFRGEQGDYHCHCGVAFGDVKVRTAKHAHEAHVDRLFLLQFIQTHEVIFA
jgi:hypothetical protein